MTPSSVFNVIYDNLASLANFCRKGFIMQFKPEITSGTILTIFSLVFVTGIAWGGLTIRVDGIVERMDGYDKNEEKIEQRVDAKLNRIDNRLERIEGLLMRRQ